MSNLHFGLTLIDRDIHDYLVDPTIGKHTYTNFGLRMVSMYIPMPKTKTQFVDLPFASGSLDMTEAGGVIPYADREGLNFEFVYFGDLMHWPTMIHDLGNYLHGKKLYMIPDNDLEHYYVVRLELDSEKTYKHTNKVVLSGTAEPYKYILNDSTTPWMWDPFSFVDGEITAISEVVVNGTTTATIAAGGLPNCPSFIVTQAGAGLGVVYNTNPPRTLYMQRTGTYRFPQIKAGGPTATTLTFVGSGRITISYRKKFL